MRLRERVENLERAVNSIDICDVNCIGTRPLWAEADGARCTSRRRRERESVSDRLHDRKFNGQRSKWLLAACRDLRRMKKGERGKGNGGANKAEWERKWCVKHVLCTASHSPQSIDLILHFDAAQVTVQRLLALAFGASDVESNVNDVIAARHVSAPIHLVFVGDRYRARTSVPATQIKVKT